jgi:colanic acid/amylovoran biosynthesis glycosyltransferase
MNKKIAYIIPQYPAVSETFIADQVNYFCENGFDLTVYSFSAPINNGLVFKNPKVKIVYLNSSKNIFKILIKILNILFYQPRIILNIIKQSKTVGLFIKYIFWCEPFVSTEFNLIHCHFGTTATKYCLINKMLNRVPKFITTFYGYDISHIVKVKGEKVYDEVKKHSLINFVMSLDMKNRLMRLGFADDKIIINPPGADFSQIKESQKNVN